MRIIQKLFLGGVGVLALWTGLPGRAQVTLSVSPAVISNTWPGEVTLQISGIPAGAQVQIGRYQDVTGSGVIQTNDVLLDAIKLTDNGSAFVEQGITNFNVPYDANPATGAISATFNLAAPRPLGNLVGNFIYKVSSVTGAFTPVTATFVITNAATGAGVSGIIYSNNLTPLPYALAVALSAGGQYAGAASAGATGQYQLNLEPGNYRVVPFRLGYVSDFSLAVPVSLTSGTVTTNLSQVPGTVTISGNVNGGAGNNLGGVLLELTSGSQVVITATDTNGNYSAAVTPAAWKVDPDTGHLAERAYVAPQNSLQVDTSGGSQSGQNIVLTKANALFYGRITDTNGVPFANIGMDAQDQSGLYQAMGYSDTNGQYAIAIPGGPNYWYWSPDGSSLPPAAYLISSSDYNAFPASGQAIQQNFTVIPASAQISGHLQDQTGSALSGVGISVNGTVYGTNYNAYVDTDNSGNYTLAAVPGTWTVSVNASGSDGLYSQYGLTTTNTPTVTVPPTNIVVNFTAVHPQPLSLRGGTLPFGVANRPYSFSLNAAGGVQPYSYSLASGALPSGLNLSGQGFFSGTPNNSGTSTFTIQVNDQTGTDYVTASFTLVVAPPLQITTSSLSNAVVGGYYSVQLQLTGGEPPYAWGVPPSLPQGLSLSTNGLISGVPQAGTANSYPLAISVFDSSNQSATQNLTLVVTTAIVVSPEGGPLLSSPAVNPDGSFQFGFSTMPDTTYTVEYSPDLLSWMSLLSFQSPGGPMLITDPNAAGRPRGFYRVKSSGGALNP
jgi:hypothetical protein